MGATYTSCAAKLNNNRELETKQLVMKALKSTLHKHPDIGVNRRCRS